MAEGRIYTIVLDDLHTRFTNTPRVQRALREFIEQRFGANDLAAVVYTSGRTNAGQEFTNNPQLLLAAIDRLRSVPVMKTPVCGSVGRELRPIPARL